MSNADLDRIPDRGPMSRTGYGWRWGSGYPTIVGVANPVVGWPPTRPNDDDVACIDNTLGTLTNSMKTRTESGVCDVNADGELNRPVAWINLVWGDAEWI